MRASTLTVNYTENLAKGPAFSGIALSTATGGVPVTVKISGKSLSVKPVAAMAASKQHTLTIPAGALLDVAGNPGPAFTLTFTTGAK